MPCAYFTAAGLRELRALLEDRQAMDPERFGHLRRELGLDAGEGAANGGHDTERVLDSRLGSKPLKSREKFVLQATC